MRSELIIRWRQLVYCRRWGQQLRWFVQSWLSFAVPMRVLSVAHPVRRGRRVTNCLINLLTRPKLTVTRSRHRVLIPALTLNGKSVGRRLFIQMMIRVPGVVTRVTRPRLTGPSCAIYGANIKTLRTPAPHNTLKTFGTIGRPEFNCVTEFHLVVFLVLFLV